MKAWAGGRAEIGVKHGAFTIFHSFIHKSFYNTGRYYYEATVMEQYDEGFCRFGFSTKFSKKDLGMDASGFGFGATGKKSNSKLFHFLFFIVLVLFGFVWFYFGFIFKIHNRQFDSYGTAYSKGCTVGCYVDCEQSLIGFTLNGKDLGIAFSGKAVRDSLQSGLYPAICLKVLSFVAVWLVTCFFIFRILLSK